MRFMQEVRRRERENDAGRDNNRGRMMQEERIVEGE